MLRRPAYPFRPGIKVLVVCSVLLPLTFFNQFTSSIIEKVDWHLQFSRRSDIVKKVTNYTLNPNVSWNGSVCQLPYSVPVVSNDGNELIIERENSSNPEVTVQFFIYRNFLDHPPTTLTYTTNPVRIAEFEKKIMQYPQENWKYEDNWYRINGY